VHWAAAVSRFSTEPSLISIGLIGDCRCVTKSAEATAGDVGLLMLFLSESSQCLFCGDGMVKERPTCGVRHPKQDSQPSEKK
jgi:hypothetical protein